MRPTMIDSCGKYRTADGRVAIINTIDNSTDGYNCLGHPGAIMSRLRQKGF